MVIKHLKRNKHKINNFIWRALQIFGKQGFSFLSFLIFISILSPKEFGTYGYIMAAVWLLAMFADSGITGATAKYVAEYNTINKRRLKRLPFNSAFIMLLISIILTVFVLLFGMHFWEEYYNYILIVLPIIFLSPLTGIYSGIYTGLKRFKQLAIISLATGAVSLVINYIMIIKMGLTGALIAQDIFYGLLLAILAFNYRDIEFKIDTKIMKPVMTYSLIIGLTSLSYYLYTRADIVILGKFGFITEIAYYNVLNKIFELIILPFAILGQVSAPHMTALYARKLYSKVKKDFVTHSIALFCIGLLIAAAGYFIIPLLIKLFFSEYFTQATLYMFSLLIFLIPLRVMSAYTNHAHTGPTGNAHLSLWPMIIAGVANVVLDIFFIGWFGFIGVVYSTLICYTFTIFTVTYLYYKKMRKLGDG